MLICYKCGATIENDELKMTTQCHGYTSLGQPLNERVADTSCSCGGEFVEATKCAVCGEWFDNSELEGVCEDCLEEHYTVGMALKIGDDNRINVEVNSFIASVLNADRINHILEKWVEENFVDGCRDVRDFLNADKSCFSEWVENEA